MYADKENRADVDFLRALYPPEFPESDLWALREVLRNFPKSKSQFRQDLFVLSQLKFQRNGFFVEFGATDGIELSNTHLLEKEFAWSGVLAEPALIWQKALERNRNAMLETSCVWESSGSELLFREVRDAGLSTISSYIGADEHRRLRKHGRDYFVKSISLGDLLDRYKAPSTIDYLSMDTEGSEYQILKNFDFARYRFRVITCEHNYTESRERIHYLLTRNGYRRVHEDISFTDDWYVAD